MLTFQLLVLGTINSSNAQTDHDPALSPTISGSPEVALQLQQLREHIEQEERKLATAKKRRKEIETSVHTIKRELSRRVQEESAIQKGIQSLEEQAQALEEIVKAEKENVKEERRKLRSRIIAVYKMHRQGAALDYLIHAHSAIDLLKRTRLFVRVVRHDGAKIDHYGHVLEELGNKQQELRKTKEEQGLQLEQKKNLQQELEQQKFEQGLLLQQLKQQEKFEESLLGRLKSSAGKLEQMMSSLMGSKEKLTAGNVASLGKETLSAKQFIEPHPQEPSANIRPFPGMGLASLRGKLPIPINGQLIQRFGRQQHEEFADILFVKGLEFRAPVGTKVHCVAKGKVAVKQILPGYGNVIIVDHGARYYTLYARLAGSLHSVNEVIEQGEVIAVLGEPDARGRNFYFELRVGGKAEDPLEFFKDKP